MNCKKYYKLFAITAILFLIIVFSVLIYRNRTNSLEHFSASDGANFRMYVETTSGTILYLDLDNNIFTLNKSNSSLLTLEIPTGDSSSCTACGGSIDCSNDIYYIKSNDEYIKYNTASMVFEKTQTGTPTGDICNFKFKTIEESGNTILGYSLSFGPSRIYIDSQSPQDGNNIGYINSNPTDTFPIYLEFESSNGTTKASTTQASTTQASTTQASTTQAGSGAGTTQAGSGAGTTQASNNLITTQAGNNAGTTQASNNLITTQASNNLITTQASNNLITTQASNNLPTRAAPAEASNFFVAQQAKQTTRAAPVIRDDTEGNDFIIRNRKTDNMLMTINNVSDYILEHDQVIVGKKFKMLKFFKESNMTVFRNEEDKSKDFTLGFYFRIYETQVPVVFEEFLLIESENNFQLKADMDLKNNSIIFRYQTASEPSNSIQVLLNNAKILNYIIIQINNNTDTGFPEITFNLNNQLTKFKFSNNDKIQVQHIKFQNYEGYLGRVLLYNDIVRKSELCSKYNCKLSCFRPDGSKDYGGDVNLCIKDCNKSCNDIEKCQKICIDCEVEEEEWDLQTKLRLCPWLKDIKKLDKSPPDAPKIRGFPGDSKVLIEWKKPFNGRGVISNYIIMVYETFNKKNGIQVNISSNPECEICEHEIKNLKNQVYYDIIVKAVNNVGIGKSSNIVTIAPNGEKLKNEMNNIFYELDYELDKNISQEAVDVACNNINFQNTQQHALDNQIFDFDKYVRN